MKHYIIHTALVHTMLLMTLPTITATDNTSPATSYRSYLPIIGATCAAATASIYYARRAWGTTKTSSIPNGNRTNTASHQGCSQEYRLSTFRNIKIIQSRIPMGTKEVYCQYNSEASEASEASLSITSPPLGSGNSSIVIKVPNGGNMHCWALAIECVDAYNTFVYYKLNSKPTPESLLNRGAFCLVYSHKTKTEGDPNPKIRSISIPTFDSLLQSNHRQRQYLSHMLCRMLKSPSLSSLKINIYAPNENAYDILINLMNKAKPAITDNWGQDLDKTLTSLLLETDNSLRYSLSRLAFHYYCKYSKTRPKISRGIKRFCSWLTPEVFLG